MQMPTPSSHPQQYSRTYRVVTAAFGLLFLIVALLIVVTSDTATRFGALLAAIIVGGLGLDALISALRDKRSLLSRIGPLP
jgi:hypothetical protein